MKALITGCNGFVGRHLTAYLESKGIEVYGADIAQKDAVSPRFTRLDLLDPAAADALVAAVKPDCVYHLAGQSNVAASWKEPSLTLRVNVAGAVNLMDAVRKAAPGAKMVVVGSADQYGLVSPEMCPLTEDMPNRPASPYALSKALQEQAAQFYAKHFGLQIVLVRAFNHIGPGQGVGFVIPDFASRIARIEAGLLDRLEVGNLSAGRDFSDVRDVVRGYAMLMEKGRAGEVYNIGSGTCRQISDILKMMLSLSKADIEVYEDPARMRPSDAPMICGDCQKIRRDTGYAPERQLKDTLAEVLDEWRSRVRNADRGML